MEYTPRLRIPYPDLIDVADANLDLANLAAVLDIAVIYGQGPLASRPISTPSQPGIQGRFYAAMDVVPITIYYDTGTSWISVGQISDGSIVTSMLADHSVTEVKLATPAVGTAEIFDLAVSTGKIADLAVTAAKLASALKPSQGAGGGVEALRAIGPNAGQVVGGDDPRLRTGSSLGGNYGDAFPAAGLFTGYAFLLHVVNPDGGDLFWPFIYRPDLDATYPWHSAGGSVEMSASSPASASVGAVGFVNIGPTVNVPRAGIYRARLMGVGTNRGGGSGGDNTVFISLGITGAAPTLGDLSSVPVAQFDTAQHSMSGELVVDEMVTIGSGGSVSMWARAADAVNQVPGVQTRKAMLRPVKLA